MGSSTSRVFFGDSSKVLKCLKALYGTKQGARCWWKHINKKLRTMGFLPSQFNQSFYVLRRVADVCVVWVHVHNSTVTGSSLDMIREVEAQLKEHIKIKWSNTLDTIVGLQVEKVNHHHYTLSQPFLTKKILMDNTNLLKPLLATSPLTVGTTL